jgi:hypothetical protein
VFGSAPAAQAAELLLWGPPKGNALLPIDSVEIPRRRSQLDSSNLRRSMVRAYPGVTVRCRYAVDRLGDANVALVRFDVRRRKLGPIRPHFRAQLPDFTPRLGPRTYLHTRQR